VAFSVESVNKGLAAFRGYAQYFIGIGTGIGLIKASDGTDISQALGQVIDGLNQVVTGGHTLWVALLPFGSVALAWWSSWTAKTTNQAAQVQAAVKDPNTVVPIEAKVALLDAAAKLPEVNKDTPILVSDLKLAQAVPAHNVKAG